MPGIVLAFASILLKVIEYRLLIIDNELALYGGVVALIFTVSGIFLGRKMSEKGYQQNRDIIKTNIAREPAMYDPESGLSKREFQILELMAEGKSNKEISEELFVSIHTVKSHASNLFEKLEVKSRTQAIVKAKTDKILS